MIKHTVKSGESLSLIAKAYLGDAMRYPEIARANGIAAPYTIRIGQVILIPELEDLQEVSVTAQKIPEMTIWHEGDGNIDPFALEEISVTATRDYTPFIVAAGIAALALSDKKGKRKKFLGLF